MSGELKAEQRNLLVGELSVPSSNEDNNIQWIKPELSVSKI